LKGLTEVESMMNFGVLIFPSVEELNFVGPWEILGMWSKFANGPKNCLIVARSIEPVVCAKGLSVNPHVSFNTCPPLDFLLVPGGEGTAIEVENRDLTDFISSQALSCRAVLSVCTGSFLLHRAGLLSGRRATTHWGSLGRLRGLGDVTVVEERVVKDANIWTAAGVSSGIDLMLSFIADYAGEKAAGTMQLAAEYYPSTKFYGDLHKGQAAPRDP
jgi:transcriptional regulator GlxA family with amidase domain